MNRSNQSEIGRSKAAGADDYDAEHRYDRPPVPALRAMLAEHVIYMGSVSKRGVKTQPLSWHCQRPLTPGLVLGYAARTPTEITEAVATIGEALSACSVDAVGSGEKE